MYRRRGNGKDREADQTETERLVTASAGSSADRASIPTIHSDGEGPARGPLPKASANRYVAVAALQA
jgi:hypothetical protein